MKLPAELEHKMYGPPRGIYDCIKQIEIVRVPRKLEVIYVLPTANDKVDCIEFGTLAGIVEHQGKIGSQFAHFLRRWARIEAGELA